MHKNVDKSNTVRNQLGDKNWYFTDTLPWFWPTVALIIYDFSSSKWILINLSSVIKYLQLSLGQNNPVHLEKNNICKLKGNLYNIDPLKSTVRAN